MPKAQSELAMAREGKVGKISIIGPIGWDYWDGMSYPTFKKALADLGDVNILEVEINSPGGIVTDGVAMVNALREHPASVHTYNAGVAGSMGSVLLLAGDRAFIPDNAMTFIHKPLSVGMGNADDMRKVADELDKFESAISNTYMKSFNGSKEELSELIASETWYTSDEMLDKFSNVTIIESGEQQAAATSDPIEILGDIGQLEESFLDKAVNKIRNSVQGNSTKEVDMPITPEEKQELVTDVTASVVEALKKEGVIKEEEPEDKVEDAVEIEFEGEKSDPEAVQAHMEKIKAAQAEAAVDWSDLKSVAAYHKAITGASVKPPVSAQAAETTVAGKSEEDESFSDDAITATIDRMAPSK